MELLYPLELSCQDENAEETSVDDHVDGGEQSAATDPSNTNATALNSTIAVDESPRNPPVRRSTRLIEQSNLSGSTILGKSVGDNVV